MHEYSETIRAINISSDYIRSKCQENNAGEWAQSWTERSSAFSYHLLQDAMQMRKNINNINSQKI